MSTAYSASSGEGGPPAAAWQHAPSFQVGASSAERHQPQIMYQQVHDATDEIEADDALDRIREAVLIVERECRHAPSRPPSPSPSLPPSLPPSYLPTYLPTYLPFPFLRPSFLSSCFSLHLLPSLPLAHSILAFDEWQLLNPDNAPPIRQGPTSIDGTPAARSALPHIPVRNLTAQHGDVPPPFPSLVCHVGHCRFCRR